MRFLSVCLALGMILVGVGILDAISRPEKVPQEESIYLFEDSQVLDLQGEYSPPIVVVANGATIRNGRFRTVSEKGYAIDAGYYRDVTIEDCIFEDLPEGTIAIFSSGTSLTQQNNVFERCPNPPVLLVGWAAQAESPLPLP